MRFLIEGLSEINHLNIESMALCEVGKPPSQLFLTCGLSYSRQRIVYSKVRKEKKADHKKTRTDERIIRKGPIFFDILSDILCSYLAWHIYLGTQ